MFKRSKYLILSAIVLFLLFSCSDKSVTIGVVTGTTFEEKAREFAKVDEVKLYKDDNLTLLELANGRLSGVITDRMVGLIGIKEGGFTNLKLAGDLIYKETIGIAISQDDDALRQAVNRALAKTIASGKYAVISKKYFGVDILEGIDYKMTYKSETEATDGSLERVLEKGSISFAMSGGYPPFNYFTEDDVLTGFDVEIGMAIAEELGVKYEPVTTDWSGILEGLRSGRYDGILGSMAVTEERLKVVDFSNPYYYSGAQLIVSKDSEITGPQDLK